MKLTFLAKQTGDVTFKKGDTLTLKQEIVDKRQVYVSNITENGKGLEVVNTKEVGFSTIKDMTKFAKDKKTSFQMEDLRYYYFEVVAVRGEEVVIETELPTLGRYFKVSTEKSMGKLIQTVNLKELLIESKDSILTDLEDELGKEAISLRHFKGYISSHDGKEVTINIDKLNESIKFFMQGANEFNKAHTQAVEKGTTDKTVTLDVKSYDSCRKQDGNKGRKLLNKGDILKVEGSFKELLVEEGYQNLPKELKVTTEGAYLNDLIVYVAEYV